MFKITSKKILQCKIIKKRSKKIATESVAIFFVIQYEIAISN